MVLPSNTRSFNSLAHNRRICGSLPLAHICLRQTSHIPKTLSEIRLGGLEKVIKNDYMKNTSL